MSLSNVKGKLLNRVVLCVEDEPLISKMYKKGLRVAGAEVISAVDGCDGLSALEIQNIDIILLDLEMPNLNGFEVLQKLRKDPRFYKIPVIVLSNSSSLNTEKGRNSLEKMGNVHVFLKCDLSLEALINRIVSLLN